MPPDYTIPLLQPLEIRHLRKALRWSQPDLAEFLARDRATISRWETGLYAPDDLAAGVLYQLWLHVFGSYEGPYRELPSQPGLEDDVIRGLGTLLLTAGVGFVIVKGLEALGLSGDDE